MRRTIIGFLFVLFTSAPSQAVTLNEVIDLTRAGLGDEVLLALIEVDGGVFDVDPATLTRLKQAGVSERVIIAMVRSGRVKPVAPDPQPLADVVASQTAPEVIYVPQPAPVVREVAVPYPVYVAVPVGSRGRHDRYPDAHDRAPGNGAGDRQDGGYQTDVPDPSKGKAPIYWGFGGKLRPDAWQPPPPPKQRPPK